MGFSDSDDSPFSSDSDQFEKGSEELEEESEEDMDIDENIMQATNLSTIFNDKSINYNNKMNSNINVASNHQLFCQPSKMISTKNNDDLKFEASHLKLLSHESIMKATLSKCCSKQCLASISKNREIGNFKETYQLIKACRLELMGLDKKQRTDEIRNLLKG
jgi:hypothetical protein